MTAPLQAGDRAPDFTLAVDGVIDAAQSPQDQATLSDYAGRRLVLYFYPKDDTPGCTTQATDFTRLASEFEAEGVSILGVSRDTLSKHAKFRSKHGLSVALGSDPDHEIIERYGAWVEKTMYGRTSMGIERSTFLIGPTGVLEAVWRKVRAKDHAQVVLDEVRKQVRAS